MAGMLTQARSRLARQVAASRHWFDHTPLSLPDYSPASPQAEQLHLSDKHIKFLFGGDRSGKTGTISYEFITLVRRFPGLLYWAVALTEDKLSAIWKWHQAFLASHEIAYINWRITEQVPRFIVLTDGGKIEYKTWKSGPGSFSADSVKVIQLDEDGERAISTAEQVYNDCLSRIIDCDGYILGGATPVLGKNWMYRRLFRYNCDSRQDHTPDPDIQHWTVALLDNRYIPLEQKLKAKGRMSADEVQRRFYGVFTTLEGAVFKEWREDKSVLRGFPLLPAAWRRAAAIDLGYDHPFVCLWGALSPDDELYVYEEYTQRETHIAIHAEEIRRREFDMSKFVDGGQNRGLEARVCDHERQSRAELDYHGILTEPADKANKEQNIMIANRIMMRGKLFVAPSCHMLINQLGTCHYRPTASGKEEVVKRDDDAVDAFLYLCAYFFGGSNWDVSGIVSS